MRVRVRMFGGLAERAEREMTMDLPGADPTAGDVVRAVRDAHPDARGILKRISIAVNRELAHGERRLEDGDEVALLPPVAGGARVLVGLRDRPTVEEALAAVAAEGAGGTVAFVGTVRDSSDAIGTVRRLEYSAYEEMAERELREIADEATTKWPLDGVAILHAVGELAVGDVTVVVACSSAHRGEAFDACRYAIDEVKRRAPIWKKEVGPAGERWVGLEG